LKGVFRRFRIRLKRRKAPEEKIEEVIEEREIPRLTVRTRTFLRGRGHLLASYPLYEPWAYAFIVEDPRTGKVVYNVEEVTMNETELKTYREIIDYITWELEPPEELTDAREYLIRYARKAIRLFQIRLGRTPGLSWAKISYYVERDLLGYGPLDPIFRDPNIEDISCNGVGIPIYVWHRKFESLPTNIVFTNEKELDEYVLKLAHMAGKHISVAYPILDAILPGGHRVAATFQKEVSTKGSTFTIRKFRADPITIIDLIDYRTISPEIAAYFWLIMDYKMTTLILGVTGAGKTSTLNAMANLLRPTYKVVTIEDTPELRLPQENWVQLVSRPSYLATGGIGEITLFHLVKVSLRYRPDVIIVGEVRGEEAYVLFQAIASVSWETPVLIKDSNGNISLVPIGEFVDSFYKKGEERIAKEVEGYYILSHDGFRTVWKPIKYVLRHSTDEIYVIEYEGGGRIKATGSHSVFVLDPESLKILQKPVKEITPGDLLVTFVNSHQSEQRMKYPKIDLIELVGDPDKDYVDNVPQYIKDITKRNPVKLSTYLTLEKNISDRACLTLRRYRSKVGLPAVLTLDEDLAFVFGAYIADGSVYRRRGSSLIFSFGKTEKTSIANKVRRILKEKFNVEPHVVDRGTYVMFIYTNTLLAEFFARILGRNRREKRIPSVLWEAPRSVIVAFFEGLKADSRRTLRRRYVSYTTASFALAQDLLWLARVKGFYAFLSKEKGTGKNIGKTYYSVNVYLNKYYKKPNTEEKIPTKVVLSLVRKSRAKSMPLALTYIKRRKYLSKAKAKEILEWIKEKGNLTPEVRRIIKKIEDFMNGDLIISEVRNIRKERYNGYVYDISVPGTESFFGGEVPILLHNTGHSGMTTLHAESIDAAVKRLTSPPMNIPPSYIPLMNVAMVIKRVIRTDETGRPRPVRRITNIWEIEDYEKYREIAKWDPVRDTFNLKLSDSVVLRKISELTGKPMENLIEEIARRKAILEWLAANRIRSYKEVATYVQKYYVNSRAVLREIGVGEI